MNLTEEQKSALKLALNALDNSSATRADDDCKKNAEEQAYEIILEILKKGKI